MLYFVQKYSVVIDSEHGAWLELSKSQGGAVRGVDTDDFSDRRDRSTSLDPKRTDRQGGNPNILRIFPLSLPLPIVSDNEK